MPHPKRLTALLRILAAAAAHAAAAQTSPVAPAPAPPNPPPSFLTQSNMLGDLGGLRPLLANHGITLTVTDTENLLANVSGGVKTGATMQGLTTASLQIDTGKAFNLPGGTFDVSALQIHGRPLSPYYLDDLQTANDDEADNATRLWELWYDQAFASGAYDIKIGQQSLDQEFIASKYSALFVNTMAGWPLMPSDDLYAGGPAYPLSSLGVRLQAKLAGAVTVLGGVFDDNPAGGSFDDDPQSADAGGTRFNLNTGALFIAELQYAAKPFALPGTYKLGFWADTGFFPDQATDADGLSLANPASNGIPAAHKGDYSVYAVVDQTVWQPANSARSVDLFARLMGAPRAQNLINAFINGGVTVSDPLPGRDNDNAGLDLGIGHVSGEAAGLDVATSGYSGNFTPQRGTETLIELTYQAQLTPWLQLQPDAQFILNPGAGIVDPDDPAQRLHDEIVVGVRGNVTF